MPRRFERLLQRCVVKITTGSGNWGTGFFVGKNLILTCAHVLKSQPSTILVTWAGRECEASAIERPDLARLDVALLSINPPWHRHPSVSINPEIEAGDSCYIFGFSDQRPQGDPGLIQVDGQVGGMLKLRGGQVRPGHSGSPVLNLRTGYVCGIVQITRDRSIDLGGIGWIINDPEILHHNQTFTTACKAWDRIRAQANRPPWLVIYKKLPASPAPFSPAWFIFTQRTIGLVGRDREMEALKEFLEAKQSFSWWALCGPSGIGKSRLAHEITLRFNNTWHCGFVDLAGAGSVDEIGSALKNLTHSTLLIVDDAATFFDQVAAVLKLCCNLAKSLRYRLRVLLLEREAGESAEWWRKLISPLSATSATLQRFQHAEPFILSNVQNREREVTAGWLEAGAPNTLSRLPRPDAPFWAKVKQVTDSRPLLLGLVAAAIAQQQDEPDVSSMTKLLRPILEREVNRWRDASPTVEMFKSAIDLIAIATILDGLPLPMAKDFVMLVIKGTNPSVVMVKDNQGKLRFPRFEEVEDLPIEIQEQMQSVFKTLTTIVPPDQVKDHLDFVRGLCPPRWALEPALIGDFFLNELWAERTFYDPITPLPFLDDSHLQRLLLAAMRIAPAAAAEKLNNIRKTTNVPASFVRAITLLTVGICRNPIPDEAKAEVERNVVSHLLLNAHLRIGNEQPSSALFERLWSALEGLVEQYPKDLNITYRYFKVLPTRARRLSGEDAIAIRKEIVTRAPFQITNMKANPEEQAELFWAEALLATEMQAGQSGEVDVMSKLIKSAELLQSDFPTGDELYEILSMFYLKISIHTALPDRNLDDKSLHILRQLTAPLEACIRDLWASRRNALRPKAIENVGFALLNVSLAYYKMEEFEHASQAATMVESIARQINDSRESREMLIKAMHNALPHKLMHASLEDVFQIIRASRELLHSGADSSIPTFFSMMRSALQAALTWNEIPAFRRELQLLIVDISLLQNESNSSDWMVHLVESITSMLIQLELLEELKWVVQCLISLAEQHSHHLLSLLSGLTVLPLFLNSGAERLHAERILNEGISMIKRFPRETVLADKFLDAAIAYWFFFGDKHDGTRHSQTIGGICEVRVISQEKSSGETEIQASIVDAAGDTLAVKEATLLPLAKPE